MATQNSVNPLSQTRIRIISLTTVGVIVLAGLLWWFLRPKPVVPERPVVEVSRVQTSDVDIYGEYAGRITAQRMAEVRARVEGYVDKILFQEGTLVRQGQPLFVIDKRVYQALAEKAHAQLNKALANANKAERDLARIKPLFEQNAASQLDLDNAEAAYETAKAEVNVAKADLTQAEQVLSYTTVTTPIAGYVDASKADIGTLVGPGSKSLLTTVVKSDTVMINFSMTALDYLNSKNRNVNIGQKDSLRHWDPYVTVTLPDGSEYPHRALVDYASPQVDPTTGTFSVRAVMPNPDYVLMPGEFTRVKVLKDVLDNAVKVQSKAVEIERGGAYVYVVRPDSVVERRYVVTGPEIGNDVIIERGLTPNENIVTEGFHKLHHGMKVTPVAAADKK